MRHICDTKGDRLRTFIRRMVEMSGMTVTEEEFIENCKMSHGSVEHAMELMELAEAQNKAAVEQAFPGGWQSANIQVGRKPRPGEETMVSDVRDGLMVRCWGGDMASYQYLQQKPGEAMSFFRASTNCNLKQALASKTSLLSGKRAFLRGAWVSNVIWLCGRDVYSRWTVGVAIGRVCGKVTTPGKLYNNGK
ncbi:hypothetical protein JOM56_001521 [Amanita muscaria]